MGVRTVADLRALSLDQLMARFGSWGRTLWVHCRGIDDRPVRDTPHQEEPEHRADLPDRTSDDLGEMDGILDEMAAEVASGLSRKKIAACTLTVKVRFPDFTTRTRSHTLAKPDRGGADHRPLRPLAGATDRSRQPLGAVARRGREQPRSPRSRAAAFVRLRVILPKPLNWGSSGFP